MREEEKNILHSYTGGWKWEIMLTVHKKKPGGRKRRADCPECKQNEYVPKSYRNHSESVLTYILQISKSNFNFIISIQQQKKTNNHHYNALTDHNHAKKKREKKNKKTKQRKQGKTKKE